MNSNEDAVVRLGKDPLLNTLEFLNAADLSRAECTCKTLQDLANRFAWEKLEQRLSLNKTVGVCTDGHHRDEHGYQYYAVGRSCAPTQKARVQRYEKARQYAARIEAQAYQHYIYKPKTRAELYLCSCRGCRALPNSNVETVKSRLSDYEIFVRMSDDSSTDNSQIIWEGFVPAVQTPYTRSGIYLDLQFAYTSMQWPRMKEYLEDITQARFTSDFEAVDGRADGIIHDLKVTVVAVERSCPYRTSLIIATGGLKHGNLFRSSEHVYFVMPRRIDSHESMEEDGSFVGVCVRMGQPDEKRPVPFRGLDLIYCDS